MWFSSVVTAATETRVNVTKPTAVAPVTRRVSATVSYISTRIPFKISSCGTEITRALKLIPDTTVSLREEQTLVSLSLQFFRTLLHSYLRNFSRRFGRETASPYDTYINF